MNADFIRVVYVAVVARILFEVCRYGYVHARTSREEDLWSVAALVSVVGPIMLLFYSLVDVLSSPP